MASRTFAIWLNHHPCLVSEILITPSGSPTSIKQSLSMSGPSSSPWHHSSAFHLYECVYSGYFKNWSHNKLWPFCVCKSWSILKVRRSKFFFFFKGVTLNPLALLKVWFLILLLVSFFDPHFGYLVDWKLIYKTPPDSLKGVLVSLRGGSSPWICVHTPRVPLTLTLAFFPIPDGNFQLTVLGGLELAEGKPPSLMQVQHSHQACCPTFLQCYFMSFFF